MGFLDKAKDLLHKNADKVDQAIEKAGDLVDKKTQGKHAGVVDKVQEQAKKRLRENGGVTPPNASPNPHPNPNPATPSNTATPPPATPPSPPAPPPAPPNPAPPTQN
ncbi:antitoxin [Mycolicibacterium mengxianglii]|uniref:antitoxin n=1 Tax=Mycolicibacterium mengxianglii TaxID=2736649 RepID=UPI0018D09E06|nr:antitoxin [Mycolicibacterium mengxianglii]